MRFASVYSRPASEPHQATTSELEWRILFRAVWVGVVGASGMSAGMTN
jgi:hypothetical protein